MITGSISFRDNNHIMSKILRHGMKLNISWGYKKFVDPLFSAIIKKENPAELFMAGNLRRENIQATVQSPSGTMSDTGEATFNCNFYGYEYMKNEQQKRSFSSGTKGDLVRTIFFEMGINSFAVDFKRQSELITENKQVYQNEGNFKFLYRMSREWGCAFRTGYQKNGSMFGVFIDYSKIGDPFYTMKITGATFGSSLLLDWRQGLKNVLSASWSNKQGVGGGGDSVSIRYGATGEPIYERFVATEEKVVTWRLNSERIKSELERLPIKERTDKMKEFLSAEDFESVKKYFDPIVEPTAPQGIGYEINVNMIGNPLMTAMAEIKFGKGFPDCFSNVASRFYGNKVTHTINTDGYKMALQIADAYTLNGGSFI
jgi:hypothetical protein